MLEVVQRIGEIAQRISLDIIFGLLALFFLLTMLIGSVNPSCVLPWRGRSRLAAISMYFALTAVFLGLAWAVSGHKDEIRRFVLNEPQQEQQAQPSEYRDAPATPPNELATWCAYRKASADLEKEAGAKFGADPRKSWRVGQVVAMEKETRLSPANPDKFKTDEEKERALSQSRRLKTGERVKVLEVTRDKDDHIWYRVEVVGKGFGGYIGENELFWYDAGDRRKAQMDERGVWMDAGEERLRQEMFTNKGLDFNAVSAKAKAKKWSSQCESGLKEIDIQ